MVIELNQDVLKDYFCFQMHFYPKINNNNIFAIVQSTFSDLLKDSNPLGLEWKISWVKQ